jgi:polyisoprenoid-binding protein YceI
MEKGNKNLGWKIIITFVFFLSSFTIHAQSYFTDKGNAEFQAHAKVNSYEGKSNELKGKVNLESKMVHFKLPIKSINTGVGKRNKDMFELLETDKYPNAEFMGKIVSGFDPKSNEPQHVKVSGTFTLHGVSKPLTVDGVLDRNSNSLHIETQWDMMITDYNIKPPRFLFNKVDNKHHIKVNADLNEESNSVRN